MKAIHSQSPDLKNVLASLYKTKLPGAISRKVLYMVLAFEKTQDEFSKEKLKLQKKYGTKDDKGELLIEDGKIVFTPEQRKKFDVEFNKLSVKEHSLGLLSQGDIELIPNITSEELKILLDASLIAAD
jgi:hypothetical protein